MREIFSALHKLSLMAAIAVIASVVSFVPAAQSANIIERGVYLTGPRYDGEMGQCGDALHAISSQFAEKESKFWNSSLEITGFADVHEVAFRAWASQSIPRRFCAASLPALLLLLPAQLPLLAALLGAATAAAAAAAFNIPERV